MGGTLSCGDRERLRCRAGDRSRLGLLGLGLARRWERERDLCGGGLAGGERDRRRLDLERFLFSRDLDAFLRAFSFDLERAFRLERLLLLRRRDADDFSDGLRPIPSKQQKTKTLGVYSLLLI